MAMEYMQQITDLVMVTKRERGLQVPTDFLQGGGTTVLCMLARALLPIKIYASLLRRCIARKSLAAGQQVHAHILNSGLQPNTFLGNMLVNMYAKCGSLPDARRVFDTMPVRDVYSWTAIISAYAKQDQGREAVALFQEMHQAGVVPDEVVFVFVLKACASLATLEGGKQVHAHIVKGGFEWNVFVSSALVDMYAKCGSIVDAVEVFSKMPERNVVSWNVMIAGYTKQGDSEAAFSLFQQMQQEGIKPDKVTFINILKACTDLASLDRGKQIHAQIIKSGCELEIIVGNTLVDMYAKCGSVQDARQVFNRMHERDVVSWTTMISGYAQQGYDKEALTLFEGMQCEGVKPNNVTFISVLKACASLAALERGKQVHAFAIKGGFESDVFVGNSLVDMYAKCGSINDARLVFSKMQNRNVVSWNVMIAGYVQQGCGKEALALFEQMQQEGVDPDSFTFVSIIKTCTSLTALERGKEVHAHLSRMGFESDAFVRSILVDMYAKCGSIEEACQVFCKSSKQDLVSWNAMITGYAQQGYGEEALKFFRQMQLEGLKPDTVTFVSILKACASLGALEWGKQVHAHIIKSGFELDVVLGNTLVDMYVKCGSLQYAHQVFNKLLERNMVSWNALITGYAQQGFAAEALTLFEQMQQEGVKPSQVTFVGVLSACSHAGLLDEGHYNFASMSQVHGIRPTIQHYACMVDLLGRGGHLDELEAFISNIPIEPNNVLWMTLLSACKNRGIVELGRCAFECVRKLDPKCAGAYVLISNIYAAVGKWDEMTKIRKLMEDAGVTKKSGCSWV